MQNSRVHFKGFLFFISDEKYGYLDARAGYAPPSTMIESSFKHYPETMPGGGGVGGAGGMGLVGPDMTGGGGAGPELINMTSSGGLATSTTMTSR